MSFDHAVITCPHGPCGRSLRLPVGAIGQPLSCPYCRTSIGVELGPDGRPGPARVLRAGARLPRMLLVPAIALMILGTGGVFTNGYIALDAATRPGADLEQARRQVGDLRNLDEMTGPKSSKKDKPTEDPTPLDLFAAVAGQAAATGETLRGEDAMARAWAPEVVRINAIFAGVSLFSAVGGFLILRGWGYWIALLACVAAILNVNHACCFPGTVAGLWGILVLVRDEGRRHFGK